MVSHTLSSICIPQYENFLASPDGRSPVELDSLVVPIFLLLDDSATQKFSSLKSLLREPPRAVNSDEKTEKRYELVLPGRSIVIAILFSKYTVIATSFCFFYSSLRGKAW